MDASPDQRRVARRFLEIVPPFVQSVRRALQRLDLPGGPSTIPQLRCLAALACGPHTLGELAEDHGVAAPTMSRLVDGLVARGWVRRCRDSADRRRVVLSLTPAGAAVRLQLVAGGAEHLATLLGDLTPAELAALEAALDGLERAAAERRAAAAGVAGRATDAP